MALFLAIYAYQCRFYTFASLIFSYGLATKLTLALAAPGIVAVVVQALEPNRAFNNLSLILHAQICLGFPFWTVSGKAYVGRAFELGRQFLFKWTVNWRFVGEERFLTKEFAYGLLLANLAFLVLFGWTRWLRPSGLSPFELAKTLFRPLPQEIQRQVERRVDPNFMLTTILTSMLAGLLCARSLHYQFYAYVAWSTPFLLWKSRLPLYAVVVVWAAQEWAWNVYPSTNVSSMVVVGCLAIQVIGVWFGTANRIARTDSSAAVNADIKNRKD